MQPSSAVNIQYGIEQNAQAQCMALISFRDISETLWWLLGSTFSDKKRLIRSPNYFNITPVGNAISIEYNWRKINKVYNPQGPAPPPLPKRSEGR
jgi:hypothetical protein